MKIEEILGLGLNFVRKNLTKYFGLDIITAAAEFFSVNLTIISVMC